MEFFVGTSGWSYSWNREGTLAWYVENSGLSAIELNASFYRVPHGDTIEGWAARGSSLDWAVKVNRSVTHLHLLNASGCRAYGHFIDSFRPLDPRISYYLIQFPPRFSVGYQDRIRALIDRYPSRKMAFEFRHPSWLSFDFGRLDFEGTVVTPDSPEFSGTVFVKNQRAYLRFHGRGDWYSYDYTASELSQVMERVRGAAPRTVHAFFNNDHNMLKNARLFLSLSKTSG